MKRFLQFYKQYSFLLIFIFFPLVAFVDYRFGLFALICILGPVVTSFFAGKYWCGSLCPRGSLFDGLFHHLSEKKKTPRFFQTPYFRFAVMGVTVYYFYHGISHYGFSGSTLGYLLCKFIILTTLIAAMLSMIYNERTWCTFCPVGTLASLNSKIFNRFNRNRLYKVNDSCTSCHACEKVCPMNIDIAHYKDKTVDHIDCMVCGRCVPDCPIDAIKK